MTGWGLQQQIRLVGVGGDFQLKFLELGHYTSFKRFESEIYYPEPDGVLSKKTIGSELFHSF